MKSFNKKIQFSFFKKSTATFLLTIPFLFLGKVLIAQGNDTFISNLNTPDFGIVVNDIAYSGSSDKAYVYSPKKVLSFDGINAGNKTIINFGGDDEEYGQYQYPFNAFDTITTLKMMAVDENNHFLYVVTPGLNLIRINTVTNQKDDNFVIQSPYGNKLLGDNIIRYDNSHDRLYWACRIKNQNGQNGFYLGVYQTIGNNLTLIASFTDFYSTSDPAYQIFDIAVNQTNNVFYLSRNGSYEVWEVSGNTLLLRKTIPLGTNGNIYDKTGKIIYVHNGNFHKVYCLPFGLNNAPATVFIIDGDNYNTVTQLPVAYNKVKTGIFDIVKNNLIIGYIQDGEQGCPSYDIQVYHYDGSNYNSVQTIATGTPAIDNSPLWLAKRNDNNYLLGKSNEIVLLTHTDGYTYNTQSLKSAETNFYLKGIVANNNQSYFIKATNSGVETINSDNTIGTEINTGSITYKSAFSKSLQKAWFFTRQHVDNSRIVIVNTANNSTSTITMDKPVGDVVFNPYKNQFIVVENKNSATKFKVYNGNTNTLVGEYGSELFNCEKMFIDPNNRLYVTSKMLPTNDTIKIEVYNATDYTFIDTLKFKYYSNNNKGYVKADFDFNYHNKAVYGVFRTLYAGFSPLAKEPENNDGVLIKIANDLTVTTFTNGVDLPEKIICDNDINTVNSYNIDASKLGKCYIKMNQTLKVFDCNSETFTTVTSTCSDFTYSPISNAIYFNTNGTYGNIYSVTEDGTQSLLYTSSDISTCRSININPYNGRLYLYVVKTDASLQTMLYSLNPDDVASGLENTYLHNKSLDILGDNDFYFKNQLVFAPGTNHILIPNGTHGNISIVEYEANEPLPLSYGTNWISIPRTKGNGTGNGSNGLEGDYWPTSEVLHKNNFEFPYQTLASYYFEAAIQDQGDQPHKASFGIENGNGWYYEGTLSNTYSTRGYKLNVTPDGFNILYMQGNVADPLQTLTLYANKENWIGYWLYQTQSPFDAIASAVLDHLIEIKAKDWYCYKDWSMGQQNPQWICATGIGKGSPALEYGDMVILKAGNTDITNFQWQNGNPFNSFDLKTATENFEFNEKEDYTAYLVEIDTTNRPSEIGAFIGNTCIGASKVLPEDSLVLIRGYDKDTIGTVYFVEYFSGQKSGKPDITDYFVKNSFNKGWQKRIINAAERKSHYLISFKRKNIIDPGEDTPPMLLSIYPNPALNSITLQYELLKEDNVVVAIYDGTGRKVLESNWKQTEGVHNTNININSLKNGIYLLRVSAGSKTVVKRVVINK